MSFLRRGNVRVPHRYEKTITLTRVGGMPIRVFLKDISCWEEHQLNPRLLVVMVYFTNGSNIAVIEAFDVIDAEINEEAVHHG